MPKQTQARTDARPRRRRAWKRRLAACAVALALAGGFVALSATVLFPLTRCAVVGQTRYSAADFTAAMGLEGLRPNLFRADVAALVEKAQQALPYAKVTRAGKRLPSTLRLHVEEHAPAFAQQQGEQWWLLADSGKLLELVQQPPEGLLVLRGAALKKPQAGQPAKWKNSAMAAAGLHSMIAQLRESALWPHVTGLRLSVYALPDVIYQERIRIRFGTASLDGTADSPGGSLPYKVQLAQEVLARLDAQNPGYRGELDLGVANQTPFTPIWGEDWQP